MPESSTELIQYLPAIHSILARSDLSTVSAKSVRKDLKVQYPELDIKAQKTGLDLLTAQAFQALNNQPEKPTPSKPKPKPKTAPAPKPKLKRERSPSPPCASSPSLSLHQRKAASAAVKDETDEEYALKLHAELNNVRGRTTRGGTDGGGVAKKKTTWKKKKTGADGDKKPRKKSHAGFNKPWYLSDALADVVGTNVLSRPQVTKQIWVYIKAHDLQVPTNKLFVRPDKKLRLVLPFDELNGFQIAKHIGAHLFEYTGPPLDDTDTGDLVDAEDREHEELFGSDKDDLDDD